MACIIRTERLTLRELDAGDAPFVLALLNDPGWLRHIGDRGVRDLQDAAAYIVEHLALNFWLVVCDGAMTPVGLCGIIRRDGLDFPDIGYGFLERHAGQGHATEAARAVLRHALDVMRLPKVVAITSPENTASQRVLEKIGLKPAGVIQMPEHDGPSAYFTT